ncbi:transglutaminase [Flavobacterium faecale]|uniref:Transglutaminase n=1 Tax=Flavobacterium faecale TaxID=1355330 RepID=A0A2S1L8V7_9FLAO|nr:transglutaminase family protein [Flavobacterium faecale]AWG20167.1 transglutaminase [Flavobacterium faecale]
MEFTLKSTIHYDVYSPTTFIFNIQVLNESQNQSILSESLQITPALPYKEFSLKGSKTRFIKLQANAFQPFKIEYQAHVAMQHTLIPKKKVSKNTSIFTLKNEIIPFLTPTRNCPSDKLMEFAFHLFGDLTTDLEKVTAINEWIYNSIEYVGGSSNANTTAYDTLNRKQGVCKDFAHLGIALCRALNIPARYFTCYASNLFPPDIHACFEAYLGKTWIVFDPTKLAELNQLVKIADGKDGSEIAVATLFGNAYCTNMTIECHQIDTHKEIIGLGTDFFISY